MCGVPPSVSAAALGGLSFDMTGSYAMAWGSMVVIGACAFLLQWFIDDRPRPSADAGEAAVAATA
jgi:hypothetical protein